MATNLVANMGQNYLSPCTYRSFIPKWNGYRLADTRINSSTNCSTSCEKMVKIGSVVFELKWGKNINCAATRPKLACIAEYLNNY